MSISEVLSVEQVIIDLEASTKEAVIKELARYLEIKGVLTDRDIYISSVLEREEHSTTGIGNGIAIPHGKSETVTAAAIAYAKLKTPIEWEALDDKPVSIVIMLAIPDSEKGDTHLRLLSEIAIKLMDDKIVSELKAATEPTVIINLLK
ncbi:PTS sugar transporter subunit IIA [Vagococcus salmoninarum]|uniref:PTS sugar transporter subunit IIA n=1 Tax=Vagococcus salmoninarum TaxID=2739 RepID=UPI0028D8C8F0|nr:PTS sugar transporter subunit IIA [Vagococcus salmoninarum]